MHKHLLYERQISNNILGGKKQKFCEVILWISESVDEQSKIITGCSTICAYEVQLLVIDKSKLSCNHLYGIYIALNSAKNP